MVEYWSQQNAVVGAADYSTATSTSHSTDVVDLSKFGRVAFIVQAHDQAATGNLSLNVYSGTVTTAASNTTSVTSVDFGANKDNQQWIVEVHDTALTQGHRYVHGVLTQATATGGRSAIVVADLARTGPASDNDSTDVTSITVKT